MQKLAVTDKNHFVRWKCMKKYKTLNSGATYKSRHRVTNNLFFTDHFSGPGRAPGMCVYESGPELLNYLRWCFSFIMRRFSLKVRIICQSSRSQNEKFSFIGYGCTLRNYAYTLNRQRAAQNTYTIVCHVPSSKVVGATSSGAL